ncbi:MAG: hypothetical protein ACRCX2_04720 [Paraclostridium sp.]
MYFLKQAAYYVVSVAYVQKIAIPSVMKIIIKILQWTMIFLLSLENLQQMLVY